MVGMEASTCFYPLYRGFLQDNIPVKIANVLRARNEAEVRRRGLCGLRARTKVAEVGNSIAIRVPKEIAAFLSLQKGKEVTLLPKNRHDLVILV